MIEKLGVQLYTIREFLKTSEDVKRSFEKLSEIGYREIHTAGLYEFMTPEEFKKAASDNGLDIIGTHIDVKIYEERTDEMVSLHEIYGTKNAGTGAAPGIFQAPATEEYIKETVERIRNVVKLLNSKGLVFNYHHHDLEFVRVGNTNLMNELVAGLKDLEMTFVLDTFWLQAGGVSITEYLELLKGRADILHLKDFAPVFKEKPAYAEIFEGNINWNKVIKKAEEAGVKHFIVEQDICKEDPFTSLKMSIDNLKNAGLLR